MTDLSPRTLVLLGHPDLARSRINQAMAGAARGLDHVTLHDLHAVYPDRRLDIAAEQRLVSDNEVIVLQFPLHWYSVPGFLKQWLDEVMTRGFAYDTRGLLTGKTLLVVTSTGGVADAYRPGAFHRFTMTELLRPLEQTAHRMGMTFGSAARPPRRTRRQRRRTGRAHRAVPKAAHHRPPPPPGPGRMTSGQPCRARVRVSLTHAGKTSRGKSGLRSRKGARRWG
ncbi:NAD(P)H-dependent oxidoreductase [Streptomyces kaempferi]